MYVPLLCEDDGGQMTKAQLYQVPLKKRGFFPGIGPPWNTFNFTLFKYFGRHKLNEEQTIKTTVEFLRKQ